MITTDLTNAHLYNSNLAYDNHNKTQDKHALLNKTKLNKTKLDKAGPFDDSLLDSVLAKDRHYIKTHQKQLKSNQPSKDTNEHLEQFMAVVQRSQQARIRRQNSVPCDLWAKLNHSLPVVAQARQLIAAIKDHQVIIVAGETGSGKTTQLPKLALLAGLGVGGQIGHTQPRRLAARTVAARISEELGEPLGKTVGVKVRFNELGSKNSLIKLMTDGILLAELAHDKFLTNYDAIIIDEAHERSLNIDFLLGYLKQLLPKRPDLKVIITSATLDTDRFAQYFAKHGKPAPIFVVEGRSYPVEIRYRSLLDHYLSGSDDDEFDQLEEDMPTAVLLAVQECLADANQKGLTNQADILIFAATESEILAISDVLSAQHFAHTEVLPLFARQSFAQQAKVFCPNRVGRRIVVATNVAETALTVPNIRYVIDLGFARISRYNYRSRIQRLPIEAISQAAANQRAGRCGRVADGVCIRLYSQEDFLARPKFTEPEILRTNLASVILQMAHLSLGTPDTFDFMTAPDGRLINDGVKLLFELGAIEKISQTAQKKGNYTLKLTQIGKLMAKMPIDPRLARMLIAANEFDCMADMLIIVSALAVQDVRERPLGRETQADQKHALFRKDSDGLSDFVFYLHLFWALFDQHELNNFERLSHNARRIFAKKHYLNDTRIREWLRVYGQLVEMSKELGFVINKNSLLDLSGSPTNNNTTNNNTTNNNIINNNPKNNNTINNKPTKNSPTSKAANNHLSAVHFANIHRSLLSALLSFIANKTDIKGEYLMSKNQKAYLFPASVLHKKNADWLMSFEVVETSKVYMRTNAKIEPEWILSVGSHLLKYQYFEPHWSKKSGQVKAYAQISLFGLVIVNKLLVNYDKIEPIIARQIFIRCALVENNYHKPMDFLLHNHHKLQQISRLEDKLRRRDLMIDEESLYQFYDNKIPRDITSAHTFEKWYHKTKKNNNRLLYFSEQDIYEQGIYEQAILNKTADSEEFPESLQLGALKLPLSYVFDPSSKDDGVSVTIPVGALSQLDPVALLWGISGWRFDLIVQLLKSLPKDIRRLIVPIPDTAKKIYPNIDEKLPIGLLEQLSNALLKMGIKVAIGDFDLDEVDNYLKPLICVIDDNAQVIDKSRDLSALLSKYQDKTQTIINSQQGTYTAFPVHFRFVENKHIKGVVIQQFMALQSDKKNTAVFIAYFNDFNTALGVHKMGVLTLIKLALGSKQKQLTSQIDKAFGLAYAPLGSHDDLKNLVIDATLLWCFDNLNYHFADHKSHQKIQAFAHKNNTKLINNLPFNIEQFHIIKNDIDKHFLLQGQEVLKTLKNIYTIWQTIRNKLMMLDKQIFVENIADIEDQLADLSLADFIYKTPVTIWQNYSRYLSAMNIRLDKLPNNIDSDCKAVYLLDTHMERIAQIGFDDKYSDYRWLVEEYRINLFAQPMKTLVPISDKRLEKLWVLLNTR